MFLHTQPHTRYTPNTHRQQDNNKIKGLKPTENATRYQQVTAYPLMSGRNQPTQCQIHPKP